MDKAYSFLHDGGEMGKLTRQYDWSTSPVGTPDQWPVSLRTLVHMMLTSRFPMLIFWGPELITFYNDAFRPSLGDEGKHPSSLGQRGEQSWAESWPVIGPMIYTIMAGGEAVWFEDQKLPIYRNGQMGYAYWTYSFSPVIDDRGAVNGVLVTCSETTKAVESLQQLNDTNTELKQSLAQNRTLQQEQYATQQQMRESEARFRTMAESSGVLIAVVDETSNATYFNKAWTELTGKAMDELLRFGWADLVHPDDKDRHMNTFLEAFNVRSPFTGEFRLLSKQGTYRWLLASGTARFNDDGSFAGYISSSIDITEQVETAKKIQASEQTLRDMVLQSPIGVCVLNAADLVSEIVNDSFLKVAGKSYDAVVGKNYWVPFAEAKPVYEDALNRVVETGKAFHASEVELTLNRDGQPETIYVTFVYTPLNDAEGQVKKVAVWAVENTHQVVERRKIEEIVAQRTQELQGVNQQLVESNELLTHSNDNLQTFAYVASHDLQEPLRKILQFGDLLKARYATSTGEELLYLERMQAAASRMSTLIRDLLSFSRVSTRQVAVRPVPLNQVVNAVLTDLELIIGETGAQINVDSLPTVLGDETQLGQLFQNLLSNALKFRRVDESGALVTPLIRVSTHLVVATDLPPTVKLIRTHPFYHQVDVTDNGIGFDEKYRDRIFQVFQRLHGKNEYAGTGIGLAICEKVAANHGGAITAASQPGQGATFSVYLPSFLG